MKRWCCFSVFNTWMKQRLLRCCQGSKSCYVRPWDWARGLRPRTSQFCCVTISPHSSSSLTQVRVVSLLTPLSIRSIFTFGLRLSFIYFSLTHVQDIKVFIINIKVKPTKGAIINKPSLFTNKKLTKQCLLFNKKTTSSLFYAV